MVKGNRLLDKRVFIRLMFMSGLNFLVKLCGGKALRHEKLIKNKHIKYNEQCLIMVKKIRLLGSLKQNSPCHISAGRYLSHVRMPGIDFGSKERTCHAGQTKLYRRDNRYSSH